MKSNLKSTLLSCLLVGLVLAGMGDFALAGSRTGKRVALQGSLEPLTGISQMAAGYVHSCALTSAGAVKCWGSNNFGQLGDGSHDDRSTPVGVAGLSSGVQAIVAGQHHSCALTTSGAVKCWGRNDFGQLGDNSTTDRSTPVDVVGLSGGVAAIAAGSDHSCALTTGGAVKCWGRNVYGQLGDDSHDDRLTPVDVVGLSSDVQAVDTGVGHSCALTTGGAVKCWGNNINNQLGNGGNGSNSSTPVGVDGLSSGVEAIAAGNYHSCALVTGGAVKCWGRNNFGQLGDNSTTERSTPVDVVGLSSGVQAIAAGESHNCVLITGGAVKCWGRNDFGQLGDNSTSTRLIPVDVVGLSNGVQAIAAGGFHGCALIAGGAVKCWGANFDGQLGDSSITGRLTPVDVLVQVDDEIFRDRFEAP